MSTRQALMLLLMTAGAFAMPLLADRIGWFAAPCEILYGTLLANLVPGASQPGSFVTELSKFGFLLLLFLAGLEIDFTLLKQRGARMVLRAGVAAAGLQAIGLGIGVLLHWPITYVLLLGALSISLLLVVLQQEGISQSPFGQTLLIIGVIGEFFSILEITSYDLISRQGLGWPLALAVLKLLLLLVLGYLALRWLSALVWPQLRRPSRLLARHDPSEVGVRAALALMLCFAAVAVLLQIEPILATFIAGAVFSFAFRGRNVVTEKLATIGQGFFVPIFFISVGLGLRLMDLFSGPALGMIVSLLVAVLIVRILAIPLLRLVGLPWRTVVPGALLLAAPLTLQVAIVQVGINLGQVSAQTQGIALAAAIAGAVIFPLLARPLMPRARQRRAGARHGLAPVVRRTRAAIRLARSRVRTFPLRPRINSSGIGRR